jgi:sigma-B regulation protein RsbU (phosphoserine phosphatase)
MPFVTDLGSIAITAQHSVVEARGKLRQVCLSLGGDPISATRLSTAVSELSRVLLATHRRARLEVGLDSDPAGLMLVLSVPGAEHVELPEALCQFFEETVTLKDASGTVTMRASHLLPGVAAPDERLLPTLRQIVSQQSRDELMEELKRKNRELQESFEDLQRTTSAKERMESELNIGRDIQMSMLPVDFDAYAHRHEFDVFATLHPAREVGGDFYDFFLIDEDRLCVCVGDVSGKGVPAALFMAMTKTLIKSRATNDFSPASILTHVNDELGRNNESCMFVTVWLGILEVKNGRLSYTNAGHNPPFLRRASGAVERLSRHHGPVVAAMDGMSYGEDEVQLDVDDVLLLYTDGVTEAMDPSGALYGEGPLRQSLEQPGEQPTVVRAAVAAAVDGVWRFQADAHQADDITVMALLFRGEPEDAAAKVIELRMGNRLEEIADVIASFGEFAAECGVDDGARRAMALAFDELLNNIVSYAFADDAEQEIGIRIECDRERLSATIEDRGRPFNPFARSAPDTTLSLEERTVGGLGIHLVRRLMDEVSYVRRTDRNVVVIVKHLSHRSQQGPDPQEEPE